MAQAPPDIPRIPDLFESVDAALEVLGVIEGQDLARSIADALGGTDRSPFPERLRAPRVDDQPEGWTLFSGVDRYVEEGLRTPASRVALDGAPWLHQPDGSPSFNDQRPRGHMIFPSETTYYSAATAVHQAVSLLGRLPDPAAAAILLDDPFRIALDAIGVYIPPDLAGGAPATPVWFEGRGGRWLNMTAPMGVDVEAESVVAPGIVFLRNLRPAEMALLADYAESTNRPLPLLACLAVADTFGESLASSEAHPTKEA